MPKRDTKSKAFYAAVHIDETDLEYHDDDDDDDATNRNAAAQHLVGASGSPDDDEGYDDGDRGYDEYPDAYHRHDPSSQVEMDRHGGVYDADYDDPNYEIQTESDDRFTVVPPVEHLLLQKKEGIEDSRHQPNVVSRGLDSVGGLRNDVEKEPHGTVYSARPLLIARKQALQRRLRSLLARVDGVAERVLPEHPSAEAAQLLVNSLFWEPQLQLSKLVFDICCNHWTAAHNRRMEVLHDDFLRIRRSDEASSKAPLMDAIVRRRDAPIQTYTKLVMPETDMFAEAITTNSVARAERWDSDDELEALVALKHAERKSAERAVMREAVGYKSDFHL